MLILLLDTFMSPINISCFSKKIQIGDKRSSFKLSLKCIGQRCKRGLLNKLPISNDSGDRDKIDIRQMDLDNLTISENIQSSGGNNA